MKLTGTYHLNAAVNVQQRRIIGRAVPFGVEGNPGLAGEGIRLVVEAGGVTVDPQNLPKLRLGHHDKPVGRAVTWDVGPDGVMASFSVVKTAAGDEALALASPGPNDEPPLVAGLSIEADIPDDFTPDAEGLYRLTASNPATVSAVALVETPAFTDAQVHDVAAQKAAPMTSTVTAAEVPDDQLTQVVETLRGAAEVLAGNIPDANEGAEPMPDTAEAARPESVPALTAQTTVTREAFPYGHAGAEGRSMFSDLVASQTDGDRNAAERFTKAQGMLAEHAAAKGRVAGRNLLAGDGDPQHLTATEAAMRAILTAANEPVTRSTLLIPNTYDMEHYAAQLKFPRVIADQVPGVAIADPRPRVIPTFTSAFADGGSGEPVIASTEGTNPAQAEINVGSATVTPVWYHGLYDIARQALDAGGPETDALCMGALYESYAQQTETAAVTAILANGTAGTDVTSNADTVDVEPRTALKSIRTQLGTFYAGRGAPADAVLYASDVYQAALGADGTDGRPLYAFLSDRYQVVNAAGSADAPAALSLNVYGVPGQLAFKLTATKFVIAKWADMIRYESPTYEFRLLEPVAPASIRLAIGGYFAQRTLQAKGARYFGQL